MVDEDGAAMPNLNKSPTNKFSTEPPTSSRTLRAAVKLRNLTNNNDAGGIVHVYRNISIATCQVVAVHCQYV